MNQHNSPGIFMLQLLAGIPLLGIAFFYFDPLNALEREADTPNIIVYGMILPVIFITITIIACLATGLPLRFIPAIHRWWISKPLLQVSLLLIGISILFLSLLPPLKISQQFIENEKTVIRYFVNEYISLTGWFITGFCLINTYPLTIIEHLSKKINKLF